ncbi:MAG: ATP-NAD kinase [Chloroflexota bacterium]|nr:MAG: ATP-NAD kinase [Chloroflexota bacterium]
MAATVGIIANPASGKDIRRLVAHGSVFDNREKINIIRRALRGLDALGITHVLAMPDTFGLVVHAQEKAGVSLQVDLLDMPLTNTAQDSTMAACLMAAAGVGCIITLGGDGTNRAVTKGCGYVPLVPISTGTNNAFPVMVEGTLAGLAAGVVALNIANVRPEAVRLARCLEILRNGQFIDLALVDVVVYDERFVASRAIWEANKMRAVILSQVRPGTIGASAIAGYLPETPLNGQHGVWIEIGPGMQQVLAPIAPGLILPVPIQSIQWLAVGEQKAVTHIPTVLALDGEREIPIKADELIEIRLTQNGPHVVNVEAALQVASRAGLFVSTHERR